MKAKEYRITRVRCDDVGVAVALTPEKHAPPGSGWELVGFSIESNQVFYCWKRNK